MEEDVGTSVGSCWSLMVVDDSIKQASSIDAKVLRNGESCVYFRYISSLYPIKL